MGGFRNHKRYSTPTHPWQAARLSEEKELRKEYGLRNKREIWRVESILRKYRRVSRRIQGEKVASGEKELPEERRIIESLKKRGVLKGEAVLTDILGLKLEDFFERRLQTQVYRKGLSNSIRQARQFIIHGHIAVGGRKTTIPSYLVNLDEEPQLGYYDGSKINDDGHPMHMTGKIAVTGVTTNE